MFIFSASLILFGDFFSGKMHHRWLLNSILISTLFCFFFFHTGEPQPRIWQYRHSFKQWVAGCVGETSFFRKKIQGLVNTEQLHSNFWHRSRLPLFEFSGLLLLSPIALHYSFFQKRVCTLRTPILCSFASFLPGDTFFYAGSTAGLSLFYIYEVSIVEVHREWYALTACCFLLCLFYDSSL